MAVKEKIESNNGFVRSDELSGHTEYGQLRRAMNRGEIIRVRNGVYADATAMFSTMVDVERIVPRGVVCLWNAWMFYELTTTVPPDFNIAIEHKRKVRLPDSLPITLYYWKAENLEFGICESEVYGFKVRITDIERSVCDAVKYRKKIGLETCTEIVRSYLKRENRNISKLMDYANKLRVATTLKNYLDIALE